MIHVPEGRTSPCWTISDDDGMPYDEEFDPHFATSPAAEAASADYLDQHRRLFVVQEDRPCWEVHCSTCGYGFDEDDHGIYHWPWPLEQVAEFMDGVGWVVDGDVAACPGCACEALGHDLPDEWQHCMCAGRLHPAKSAYCHQDHRYCRRCSTRDYRLTSVLPA